MAQPLFFVLVKLVSRSGYPRDDEAGNVFFRPGTRGWSWKPPHPQQMRWSRVRGGDGTCGVKDSRFPSGLRPFCSILSSSVTSCGWARLQVQRNGHFCPPLCSGWHLPHCLGARAEFQPEGPSHGPSKVGKQSPSTSFR